MDNVQNQFKHSILYYPTIRIPSGQWLKQAVLYWDEVGSIVPQGYGGKWLIKKSPDLEYLVGEDLFHPFDPKQLINEWNFAEELVEELKIIVESERYQQLLPSVTDRLFDSEIHLDKVRYLVLDYLLEKNLVREESPNGKRKADWVFFDRTTALLYMSLLAKYLARNDQRDVTTIPGTDRPEYQGLSYAQIHKRGHEIGIEIRVKNWLPIPGPQVTIQEIVAFKRKRQDSLLPLQSLMLDFERQLKKVESIEEAKDVAHQFDLAKQIGMNDLNNYLKDAKIETTWGSLNTLLGVTTPPLIGFLASKIAEVVQVTDPIATGVFAFGLSASIGLKAYYIARQNVVNEKLNSSPYSYLIHAQKELII